MHSLSRRHFQSSMFCAGMGLLSGGFQGTAHGFYANETIRVGCIGTGGRCRSLMQELLKLPGVQIVALCDIWDQSLQQAAKWLNEPVFQTKHFPELLARSDVDAVLIGSPDHWHVPMTIAACESGKDVYVEKPLTHDLSEGPQVLAAQERTGRIVQVGTQQRSCPHIQQAAELVKAGKLGTIHKVHLTWNRNLARHNNQKLNVNLAEVDWQAFLGNAPAQPFDPYRFRQWRWFWDFGGGILTDLMVHWLDVANWFLGLQLPSQVTTIGDHFQTADLWETPDTIQTLMRYPDKQVQVYFEGTFVNTRNRAMIEFMGTEGTLYVDRGRYEFHPEPRSQTPYEELILGEGGRGADFYQNPPDGLLHLENWLSCIRSRQTPNAPVAAGVFGAAPAHYGNRSYRTGQTVYTNGNQSADASES